MICFKLKRISCCLLHSIVIYRQQKIFIIYSPPKIFTVTQKYLLIISQKIFAHQVQYTVPSVYHHAAPLHYAYAHPYVMPVAAEHKMVEEA